MSRNNNSFEARRDRVRASLKRKSRNLPRLSVFHSNHHVYAQIIDDVAGLTLVAVNTLQQEFKALENKYNVEAAKLVGKRLAEISLQNGIKQVVFDRGGYRYHGKVKALADAVREVGVIV